MLSIHSLLIHTDEVGVFLVSKNTFNSFFVDTEYLYIPFLNKPFPEIIPERRDHEDTIGSDY